MKRYCLSFALLFFIEWVANGQAIPAPTPAATRIEGFQKRKDLKENSWFNALNFTNIGPTVFSGRVVDVDVNPSRTTEMYVAYASGGLWFTQNNGTTFTPVFDQEACMTIGDIAVNWNTRTIWVGTGENNSSRSSYSGVGIFKSTDGGKSWTNMGLHESHHIGRIVLHPTNPNIIHVACLGALYSENKNRGVYSTMDGGKTWHQSLYVNPNAGAVDLVMDPSNPNLLYAATWERTRRAWNFSEAGVGSGIYKSTDGGKSWKQLSLPESGFPIGSGTGRIGLELVKNKKETILYAVVDNQNNRPEEKPKEDVLTKAQLSTMSSDSFLVLSDEKIKKFLQDNGFPEKYTVDTIRTLIKNGTIQPVTLVEYVQDANSMLFDTEVIGPEVYRSADGGKNWKKTHEGFLDNIFYTYGYYFGQIRAAKNNPKKLYILGVPFLKSDDGGATWKSIDGDNVHGDHHALWVNPQQDGHLVLGNDGGLNISYDDGAHWIKCNQPAVGQFYSINIDMDEPYNVYGGLQDNGVWVGPSNYSSNVEWHSSGQYPYKEIMGGDGMQVAVDHRDNNTVYTGFQFGNYYKVARNGDGREMRITPIHDLGERPYRWNWESPVHLSVHNQDIIYMAGERVFRSFDQGKNFKPISGDLTRGSKEGDVAYGTIVSLHESPLTFGVIYAGSDDGYIHVTRDGGNEWTKISDGLPQQLWVSCIQASRFEKGRVYASLNGYRWDHFDSYVYASEDYGKTWKRIALDLPAEPVNVIKEDPVNPEILYIGTDHGIYISLDQGGHCMLMGNMPAAPVHDLIVHPRDKEVVVATHGRSIYKANVEHVQQMNHNMSDSLTCFDEKITINFRESWGSRSAAWTDYNVPKVTFPVFTDVAGDAQLQVFADSLLVTEIKLPLQKGLGYYTYDLSFTESSVDALQKWIMNEDPKSTFKIKKADNGNYYLPPGKYKLVVLKDGQSASANLDVKKRS